MDISVGSGEIVTSPLDSPPHEHYPTAAPRIQFYEKLIASLDALTGVQTAGAGSDLPWTGYDESAVGYRIETGF
jgi:hypothetical protein